MDCAEGSERENKQTQYWVYDIVTQHAALTTTGGRVWDAARRLASFLEEMSDELQLHRPGLRVLELGSGLGWLGMTLARNLPHAGKVVLTEQEAGGGLAWLAHNVSLNSHLPGVGRAVQVAACDWLEYGGVAGAGVVEGEQQPPLGIKEEEEVLNGEVEEEEEEQDEGEGRRRKLACGSSSGSSPGGGGGEVEQQQQQLAGATHGSAPTPDAHPTTAAALTSPGMEPAATTTANASSGCGGDRR
ncbi:hypothetical protein Agub_g5518, partial [Astrephomene gubernaculifera]